MSIEMLERIIWLLREQYPNSKGKYTLKQVRMAIQKERGYDERTFKSVLKAMLEQGLLKRLNRYWFKDAEYTHTIEGVASEGTFDIPQGAGRRY